jgi:CBS domain-containing protein
MGTLDDPVRTAMTDPVRTVDGDLPVREAADVVLSEGIGSVVVAADPPGVVTKTDFLASLRDGDDPDATPVSALMTRPLVTVGPDATVREAVERMAAEGVKRLPVTEDGDLVGIVTTTDVVAAVGDGDDPVAGVVAGVTTPDGPDRYECVRCGRRQTAGTRPETCPDCGGPVRNIGVPRE